MVKNIWILPAAILGYILYRKYQLSNAVSIFFKSVDFTTMSLLNPTLNLIVQINNPTNITAVVQNIQGNLFVDGGFQGLSKLSTDEINDRLTNNLGTL